jgi:hypothetical protein
MQMARCVRGVNTLRTAHAALTADGFIVTHENPACKIMGVVRHTPGSAVLIVVNASEAQFDNAAYEVRSPPPPAERHERFSAKDPL